MTERIEYTDAEKLSMMESHAKQLTSAPDRERPLDKTSLSYWFPLIEAAGLSVPKTRILKMPKESQKIIWDLFDGKSNLGNAPDRAFYEELTNAIIECGIPAFLRTNQTSAKHFWEKTCFVKDTSQIRQHVCQIVEFSECADFMGLAWDTWVVREFLPIIPYGRCVSYGNMPVNKEFRFFVDEGKYRCHHPYWPLSALQDGGWECDADETTAYADLCSLGMDEFEMLKAMAERAGSACGGSWSIDLLETERGWFLTDMAEAHKSYHCKGCEKDTD
jgi:hypothetical protein